MSIYDVFKELNIPFSEVAHEPVYTVEQAQSIKCLIDGTGCKNLFLTDGKQYYLVILDESKLANLKDLAVRLHSARLSFASEKELSQMLGLQSAAFRRSALLTIRIIS